MQDIKRHKWLVPPINAVPTDSLEELLNFHNVYSRQSNKIQSIRLFKCSKMNWIDSVKSDKGKGPSASQVAGLTAKNVSPTGN